MATDTEPNNTIVSMLEWCTDRDLAIEVEPMHWCSPFSQSLGKACIQIWLKPLKKAQPVCLYDAFGFLQDRLYFELWSRSLREDQACNTGLNVFAFLHQQRLERRGLCLTLYSVHNCAAVGTFGCTAAVEDYHRRCQEDALRVRVVRQELDARLIFELVDLVLDFGVHSDEPVGRTEAK